MNLVSMPLSQLATVSSGGGAPQDSAAFSKSGSPFLRAGSLSRLLEGADENSLELIEAAVAAQYGLRLFPTGTVLFAKSGMSATKGHIYRLKNPAYVVNHLAALVPHDVSDGAFLAHALRRFSPVTLIKDSAYPSIRLSDIESMKIRAPESTRDRTRIAEILDKVDAVRAKRREAITQLDALTYSIFLELFGDFFHPNQKWERVQLSEIAEVLVGYPFKSHEYALTGDTVKLCRGANVLPGRIDWSDLAAWPISRSAEFAEYNLQCGDVVVAMDRPWISEGFKVARISKSDLPALLVQRVARLRGRADIPNAFLYHLLRQPAFTRHCRPTETTIPHISPTDIRTFPLSLPPRTLLQRFAKEEALLGSLTAKSFAAIEETHTLFDSLQHSAFSGIM